MRKPLLVLAALYALTAATVLVSRLYPGAGRIPAALAIASVKASLVLVFFMHLRRAGRPVAVAFFCTLILLATFIGLTFFDVANR